MSRPSNERIKKAEAACAETVRILRKHPEFDQHGGRRGQVGPPAREGHPPSQRTCSS